MHGSERSTTIAKAAVCLLVSAGTIALCAAPKVTFNGYLDADVWGDCTGNYYTNNELDLGLALEFSEKVSAHVYATAWSANGENPGAIPARYAPPSERWLSFLFDGFDITFKTSMGTFTAGDLVFQHGKFNYYFYKRLSMITPESFTRGVKYSIGNNVVTQEVLAGVADRNSSTSDIQGVTNLTLGENHTLGLYYGMKNDVTADFSDGTDFYAGVEYRSAGPGVLDIKADFGYMNPAAKELPQTYSILLEPVLTLGNFSAAFTGFVMIDDNKLINSAAEQFKLDDEMFFYLEPGYSFNDNFAVGLPLEYHAVDLDNEDDNAFWLVPTLYVYPFENVQWWIWGQIVKYRQEDAANAYGIGSEIIVTF